MHVDRNSVAVRFSVLGLLLVGLVGGASAQFPGTEEWDYSYGSDVISTDVEDGKVYLGGAGNDVVKLDSNGNEVWTYSYGNQIEAVAVENGEVWIGGFGSSVVKLDSNGNKLWTKSFSEAIYTIDVLNGNAYVGGFDSGVVKLDSSGNTDWSYNYGGTEVNSVYVNSNYVYAGGDNNDVVKLDLIGNEVWTSNLGNTVRAVDSDNGNVYAGSGNDVVKLDSTGSNVWTYNYGDIVFSVDAVNDEVYLGGRLDNVQKLDSGGNKEWTYSYGAIPYSVIFKDAKLYVGGRNNNVEKFSLNNAPKFNSTSHNDCLIGESCDYGAEVFDSDGSVDYTNLTLEYGGSTVVVDEQRTGTTSPVWNDLFTPQTGNKWLNATLSVVDDRGAVTTKEINRFLSDDAPSVTINSPGNQTYFKYGVPLDVSVSDSDSEPGEDWTCSVDKDGQQVDSFNLKEGTNSTYSSTVDSDLGSHSVDVSCSDGSGNTGSASESYTVKAYELQSVYGADPVYETENRSFDADLKTGSMVNSVDFSLNYDGGVVDTESLSPTGVETLRPDLHHEVPLVDSNQTSKNWQISFQVNKTDFQSSTTSVLSGFSSTQTQEVFWSYWIKNADTNPANGKYIETEDLKHEVDIGTESQKAQVSGTTEYSRNGETEEMQLVDNRTGSVTLQGSIDTGLADSFNQSSFQTSSNIEVQFNGKSRTLTTGQDNVEVYRIHLFDEANPGSLSTSEALNFDVQYEETNEEADTRLTIDLSVWKNRDEKIRRFNFQNDPASEHSFHIYPEWATYNIRTLTYPDETKFDLIQYWNDDKDYVRRSYFFPTTQTISNETTNVPLRTLNRSESTRIDFELLTSEGNPAENVYCRVDRKFGGGDFSTVFMIKTGSQGRGQSFAEVNEIYYSFTCYDEGEVVETFPSQIMQNPMVLTLGQSQVETVLDYQDTFDASCTYNETQISCDYQSQSEKMSEASLTVERLEPVNNMQVCSKTSETITGELACSDINTTENDYRYTVTGEYPGASIVGASGSTGATNQGMGAGGILLTLFIFLFTYGATSFNVPLGIGVGTISLLLSSAVGLWVLTPTMRATLIAVALIAGLVTRR